MRDVQRIDPNSSLRPLSGSEARQRFMAGVPGLGRLRQILDAQHTKHEWVAGLDGRRVPTGAQYKTLNRLVTNSEAIICKRGLLASMTSFTRNSAMAGAAMSFSSAGFTTNLLAAAGQK